MRPRVVLTALVALALPVVLALAVYTSAAGSLAVEPAPSAITTRTIAAPVATPTATQAKRGKERSTPATTTGPDISGNCDEAEHANDPECLDGESDDDDDSGSDDDSDNSGKGSKNSGSGGGGSDDDD